jgi:hypothetical protein
MLAKLQNSKFTPHLSSLSQWSTVNGYYSFTLWTFDPPNFRFWILDFGLFGVQAPTPLALCRETRPPQWLPLVDGKI